MPTIHHSKGTFPKGANDVVPENDAKSLVLTTSKQTLKVFNFRPNPLLTAQTNERKGRNEDRGKRRRERPT